MRSKMAHQHLRISRSNKQATVKNRMIIKKSDLTLTFFIYENLKSVNKKKYNKLKRKRFKV